MDTYSICHKRAVFTKALCETDFSASTFEKTAIYIEKGETQLEKDRRAEVLHKLLDESETEQEFVEKMRELET